MTSAKLAQGAVGSGHIGTSTIDATHLKNGSVSESLASQGLSAVPSSGAVMSTTDNNTALEEQHFVRVGKFLTSEVWDLRSTSSLLSGRWPTIAIWTGSEMLVWGGNNDAGFVPNGALYSPTSNSWRPITSVNAPVFSGWPFAVWTGSEVLVWFTEDPQNVHRYNPSTDSWTSISSPNPPPNLKGGAMTVWTGSEMIIWGGYSGTIVNGNPTRLNTGARYNPATNTWAAVTTVNAPSARGMAASVWTGSEMLIWGGSGPATLGDGSRYNPTTNTWNAMSAVGAPTARQEISAIWTGSEMIVWGGWDYATYFGTGARYNPVNNTWTTMSATSAPSARRTHTLVWTGDGVFVWGGYNGTSFLNDGARYSPANNTWTQISSLASPPPRYLPSTVWTGKDLILWSGGNESTYLQDLFLYTPSRALYIYQR